MKNLLFTVTALTLSASALFAQSKLEVKDIVKEMSKGRQPGTEITIPQAKYKDTEKAMIKWLRDGAKTNTIEANGEIYIEDCVKKKISPETMNIYSSMLESPDGVRVNVYFEYDSLKFLSVKANPDQYTAAKDQLRDWAVDVYKDAVKEELKAEEDKVKELEKEHSKMLKDYEKLEGKVSGNKRDIEKIQGKIGEMKNEVAIMSSEISKRKEELVLLSSNSEAKKEVEKQLKDLEKDRKKTEKDIDKSYDEITKIEGDIREISRQMDLNKQDRDGKLAETKKQQGVADKVKSKLKKIK